MPKPHAPHHNSSIVLYCYYYAPAAPALLRRLRPSPSAPSFYLIQFYWITQQAHFFFFLSSTITCVADCGPGTDTTRLAAAICVWPSASFVPPPFNGDLLVAPFFVPACGAAARLEAYNGQHKKQNDCQKTGLHFARNNRDRVSQIMELTFVFVATTVPSTAVDVVPSASSPTPPLPLLIVCPFSLAAVAVVPLPKAVLVPFSPVGVIGLPPEFVLAWR